MASTYVLKYYTPASPRGNRRCQTLGYLASIVFSVFVQCLPSPSAVSSVYRGSLCELLPLLDCEAVTE